MTKNLLRSALKEAQEKEQIGLLIWPNWRLYEDFSSHIIPGEESYDFALSQVNKCEEATIGFEWNGLKIPGIIAVSVEKMASSDEFFNTVLDNCKTNHLTGPIVLIPSNEISGELLK